MVVVWVVVVVCMGEMIYVCLQQLAANQELSVGLLYQKNI